MSDITNTDLSRRQISITIKDETVSRRVVLRTAVTLGCGVLLPAILIGCDSNENDAPSGSRSAAPSAAPDSGANSPARSGAPATAKNSTTEPASPATNTSTAPAATGPGKVAKASVQYQDQPKGDQRCDNCALFVEPNACLVVEGEIAPEGWSALWAPKVS